MSIANALERLSGLDVEWAVVDGQVRTRAGGKCPMMVLWDNHIRGYNTDTWHAIIGAADEANHPLRLKLLEATNANL